PQPCDVARCQRVPGQAVSGRRIARARRGIRARAQSARERVVAGAPSRKRVTAHRCRSGSSASVVSFGAPLYNRDMASSATADFTNQFLIAMPSLSDSNFGGAVVFIAEHSPKGALGLVINRPMQIDLGTLFERIDLKLEIAPLASSPVLFGGPVQMDRGFVLHEPVGEWNSTVTVGDGLGL